MFIKTLFKKLVQLIAILAIIFIVIGLLLPQTYRVQKTITINASEMIVQPLVSDFSQWYKWSPWQQIDPTIIFYQGKPSTGVGAYQTWDGKWGTGEMTITAISDEKIVFNVLFAQEHIVNSQISFVKDEEAITVTWQIKGVATTPFISGYLAILTKNILSNAVSQGLINLKTVAQVSDAKAVMEFHNKEMNEKM